MRRSLILAMALLVTCAVVAAACSGGSVSTTGTVATTETVTTTIEPSTLAVWTDLTTAGPVPDPRSGTSMVYDSSFGSVILFGGWDPDTDFGDTWEYDPAANVWTQLDPAGGVPPGRALHQMVYDPATGSVILFGGTSDAGRFGDTWAYSPTDNVWTDLTGSDGPSARSAHSMVYNEDTGEVILFGGVSDAGLHGDTWAYDPATQTWTELSPEGPVPSARSGHALAYDAYTGRVILFGGYDGSLLSDTWAYDRAANTWTKLDPPGPVPSARGNHRMVYDPASGLVVLFGGYDGSVDLYDTWAYDPGQNAWTDLDPIGPPPAREEHAMVYDPDSGRVIVFGGLDQPADVDLNDTWGLGDLED